MSPADVLAMVDVLREVGEASDSMSVEEAVAMREAVQTLAAEARAVTGLLDTQLVAVLESPREFNGYEYAVVPNGKWRPLHDKVKAEVKRQSVVDTDTGEILDAPAAVERAMKILYDLFVANATFPKTGALEKLGLGKDDVGHFESAGKKVRLTPVKPDE